MRKVFLIAFLAVFVFTACRYFQAPSEQLQDIVDAANKKCPAMLDTESRIDSVSLWNGNTLRYHYTLVHASAQNIDSAQFHRDMWPGILSNTKLSPYLQKLREDQITVENIYYDQYKKRIATFRVTPKDYDSGFIE